MSHVRDAAALGFTRRHSSPPTLLLLTRLFPLHTPILLPHLKLTTVNLQLKCRRADILR
jgi:hypothetical protein